MSDNKVEITIAGKNVTGDVSPYLSRVQYTDKLEAASDDVSLTFEDTSGRWHGSWFPEQGDTMQIKLGNAAGMLDCGLFEIDENELELSPDIVTVKAIAAGITKELRTKNSKAFEKQTLHEIAKFFADKHGFKLTGNVTELQSIEIDRKTQDNQTDLAFLSGLSSEYGLIFSIRGDQLVFIDIDELEARPSVFVIDKKDISRARFTDKTSQVYAGAKVTSRDMRSNSVKKWEVKSSGQEGKSDTLVINDRVENDSQAEARAKAELKKAREGKVTGTITIPGRRNAVAGVSFDITGLRKFSGTWIIISSVHTIDKDSGYKTDLTIRRNWER